MPIEEVTPFTFAFTASYEEVPDVEASSAPTPVTRQLSDGNDLAEWEAPAAPDVPEGFARGSRGRRNARPTTRRGRLLFGNLAILVNINPRSDNAIRLPRTRFARRTDGEFVPVAPVTLFADLNGQAHLPHDTVQGVVLEEQTVLPFTDPLVAVGLDLSDNALLLDTFVPAAEIARAEVLSTYQVTPRRNRRGPTSQRTVANVFAFSLLLAAMREERVAAVLRLVIEDYPRYALLDSSGRLHVLLFQEEVGGDIAEEGFAALANNNTRSAERVGRQIPDALVAARRMVVLRQGAMPDLTVGAFSRRLGALATRLRNELRDREGQQPATPSPAASGVVTPRTPADVVATLTSAPTPRQPQAEESRAAQPRRRTVRERIRRAQRMTLDDGTTPQVMNVVAAGSSQISGAAISEAMRRMERSRQDLNQLLAQAENPF